MKTTIFTSFWTSLVLLCFSAAPLSAEQFELFSYSVQGDGITITGYPEAAVGEIEVPAEINGLPVTTIGDWAFEGCSSLTSVTIPNSVTTIGNGAFYSCSGLTNITIPNSVTTIREWAFSGCTGLTSVTIPNSVMEIGYYAFSGCSSLTSVTIPNSVTTISESAFSGCSGLTSVTIPNSVTTIDNEAFRDCTGLTSVTIPSSVTHIGGLNSWGSFVYGCSSLTSIDVIPGNELYSSVDGVLFDADQTTLLRCPEGRAGAYPIPNSVTTIGNWAFYSCTGLTSITIPHSVTEIGWRAFRGCSGLTSVTIPNSVTTIDNEAFADCIGLTSVTIPNSVTTISREAFSGCTGLTSVTIPNSVTAISDRAFSGCTGLTSVTIPDSVTTINWEVFSGCTGLTSVTIPNSVTAISDRAFSGCSSLTSVTIPNSVTTIGSGAFSGCSGLTSVTIPNSVTTIGNGAFYSCSGLTNITIPNSVTTIRDRAFSGCTGLTSVTIPNSVMEIGYYAFSGCSSLTSVIIPDSVTTIDHNAFSGCSSLTSIAVAPGNAHYASEEGVLFDFAQTTLIRCPEGKAGAYAIPSGVTNIGYGAFKDCTLLTSVTIPEGVRGIEVEAFAGCTSLISFVVASENPNYASKDGILFDAAMTRLIRYPEGKSGAYTIPEGVINVGFGLDSLLGFGPKSPFSNSKELTSITIPGSVDLVGHSAFSNCTGLTSVTISEGVRGIEVGAFASCSGLTSIAIPSTVNSIGMGYSNDAGAFWGCVGLKSIEVEEGNLAYASEEGVLFNADKSRLILCPEGKSGVYAIPAGVTTIEGVIGSGRWYSSGSGAFARCTGLTVVTIPNSVTEIGGEAFYGCSSLTSVTIPNSVTEIGHRAFRDCSGLTSAVFFGDAPEEVDVKSPFANVSSDFTIYYLSGSTGFTSPTWEGYPSVMIDEEAYPAASWLLRHNLPYDTELENDASLIAAYALNSEPNSAPQLKPVIDPVTGTLSLSFHAASPGITYTVETSTDLENWTTDGVMLSEIGEDNRRTASISRDKTNRFLRLVVED